MQSNHELIYQIVPFSTQSLEKGFQMEDLAAHGRHLKEDARKKKKNELNYSKQAAQEKMGLPSLWFGLWIPWID